MKERSDNDPQTGIDLLIVGLGNLLLMDDGVGVHAVRALERGDPIDRTTVVEVGTAVLDALHLFEAAETVLGLDAIEAGGPAGTIYDLDSLPSGHKACDTSLHEVDLNHALHFLPENRRPRVRLLGVEPQRIDYGVMLSPAVKTALPEFVEVIRQTAAELLGDRAR
jgi:hydrogenase maturation protease